MKASWLVIVALGGFLTPIQAQEEATKPPAYPKPQAALDAMKKATAFYRNNLCYAGGYASAWSRDLRELHAENSFSGSMISIQPHGTTTVGLTMLRAFEQTDDPLFRQGAKEAAEALAWCQLASGGWGSDFDFELRSIRNLHTRRDIAAGDTDPGNRKANSSLDDNKTQSAIRFLMAFAQSSAGKDNDETNRALDFAWEGLLAAQAPNGAWPQRFSGKSAPDLPIKPASYPTEWSKTFSKLDYTGYHTLNDGNLVHVLDLLLDASRATGEEDNRYLAAARRLGDFLLLAQMPEPQPAWAQQYNHDMHPAWARKFEPPAISSIESFGAMQILVEIWLATGDEKYIETIPQALDWLESSTLEGTDNQWARFYELQTNRPLYCQADTYEITYDGADDNIPSHYGFKITGMKGKVDRLRKTLSRSRTENLEKRERDAREPRNEEEWSELARDRAKDARRALEYQKPEGYWVKGEFIDAGEYVRQMNALMSYYEAANKGGATFAAIREK